MEPPPSAPPSAPVPSRLERGLMYTTTLAAGALIAAWYYAEWRGLPWFARAAPLGTVAPSMAVAITILGALLGYLLIGRRRAGLDLAGLVVLSALGLGAALLGLHNLLTIGSPSFFETSLTAIFADPLGGPPRRLSVFGALAIILTAFALALHLSGAVQRAPWRRVGAAIAALLAAVLLYSAASRLIGVTLIAIGRFSISFWSAAALGLLNVALAVSLDALSEARRLLMGEVGTTDGKLGQDPALEDKLTLPMLLGGMAITALAILWYLHSHLTQSRRENAAFLANIAHLQVAELEAWRRERLGDAIVLQRSPSLRAALSGTATSAEAATAVTAYFDAFRQVYRYEAIALLDRDFAPKLHSGSREIAATLAAEARQLQVGATGPLLHDPIRGDEDAVWFDLIAPLDLDANGRADGFVALRINARHQLGVQVARWRSAGEGTDTVVVREHAGAIRYLSDVRSSAPAFAPGTGPAPWDTVAALARHTGEFEFGEFRDHRDVPVFALARRVPGSPWVLAVKLDRATADAGVRAEAWRLGAGFLGVTVALGLAAQMVWRKRRYEMERRHLQTERERHAAVERLARIASLVPGVVYQYQLFPDGRACFPYASEAIRQIYRVSPEEVRTDASAVFRILHADDYAGIVASVQLSARTLEPWNHEYRVKFDDGTVRWLHGSAVPRAEPDGSVLWHGFITDVTARKQVDQALHESLREKEALLKEVHHRVKNNLQVISSLLRMEVRRNQDSEAAAVLQDMVGRVHSMALLHEALYRTGTFAAVDLAAYVRRIAVESQRTAAGYAGAVKLVLELEPVQVELDRALPCGLLLNELVSNAYKHGFPSGGPGEIRVVLQPLQAPSRWRLRVSDNGVGLPADLAARRHNSLGLELVADLASQLGGRLEIGPGPGASFEIVFPVHPVAAVPAPPAPA